jgi:hypothetical protein
MDEVEKAEGPLFLSMGLVLSVLRPRASVRGSACATGATQIGLRDHSWKRGRRHEVDFGSSPLCVEFMPAKR